MKTGVKDILGKCVTGAMLKHCRVGDHSPSSMLVLMFDDELTYEFYSQVGQIKPWVIELDASVLKAGEQSKACNAHEFLFHWGEAQFSNELLTWFDGGNCQIELFSR